MDYIPIAMVGFQEELCSTELIIVSLVHHSILFDFEPNGLFK